MTWGQIQEDSDINELISRGVEEGRLCPEYQQSLWCEERIFCAI
jgi:hypothetical protein